MRNREGAQNGELIISRRKEGKEGGRTNNHYSITQKNKIMQAIWMINTNTYLRLHVDCDK